MLNLEAIRNTLNQWIGDQTGVTAVWEGRDAPPGEGAYLSLRVSKLSKIGRDIEGAPDEETGFVTLIGNREFILSIQGFRDGSLEALEALRTSLDLTKVQEQLQNADDASDEYTAYAPLAAVDSQPIQNLNGLTGSTERWRLELRFRTHSELTPEESVDTIGDVTGDGTVGGSVFDTDETDDAADLDDSNDNDLHIQLNAASPEWVEP